MSAFEIRPRSPTEIVDAAFEILRRDYLTLITITAVIQLPLLVIQMTMGLDISNPARIAQNFTSLMVLGLLNALAMTLADAAIIHAVSEMYMDRPAHVGRALGRMLQRGIPLVISGTLRMIASYLAMFALLVPGLYVYFRWATLPAVVVLEDQDTFGSMGRAWALGKDQVRHSLNAILLGGLIYVALSLIFGLGLQVAGTVVPLFAQPGLVMAVQRLPAVLFYPLVSVITTVVYYDIRVRKEALDLEMMANELGAPA